MKKYKIYVLIIYIIFFIYLLCSIIFRLNQLITFIVLDIYLILECIDLVIFIRQNNKKNKWKFICQTVEKDHSGRQISAYSASFNIYDVFETAIIY